MVPETNIRAENWLFCNFRVQNVIFHCDLFLEQREKLRPRLIKPRTSLGESSTAPLSFSIAILTHLPVSSARTECVLCSERRKRKEASMEEETQTRRRGSGKAREPKRRRRASSESFPFITLELADSNTLFSLLLAALAKAQTSSVSNSPHLSLIKKCLRKFRVALLSGLEDSTSPCSQGLPVPILSLLPVIIKSKYGLHFISLSLSPE